MASEHLPVNDEKRLGDLIMADIRRDPAFLEDAVLQEYIEQLWSPLVIAARRQGTSGPIWTAVLPGNPSSCATPA